MFQLIVMTLDRISHVMCWWMYQLIMNQLIMVASDRRIWWMCQVGGCVR